MLLLHQALWDLFDALFEMGNGVSIAMLQRRSISPVSSLMLSNPNMICRLINPGLTLSLGNVEAELQNRQETGANNLLALCAI